MKIKSILLVVSVAAFIISCSGGSGAPGFGDNEFAVRTIGSQSAATQITYPATIRGIQDVEVRPKVSGFITKVYVHEGQTVSAGQVMFTIDSETYQAAVRQAQAALNTARAQANTAKLTYENNQSLYEQKIIGEYELSTAKNSYATAQASVSQTQAALASACETLSWCTVKSPAAGVVGSLPYKVGTLVSASNALTTVSNISSMEVFFSMSEGEILQMTRNSGSSAAAINAMPAVKLQLADGTVYSHPGKVVKISGVIDATTGAYSVIAHFANPEKLLKSGGAGQIIVPNVRSSAIVIPQEATSEVQDKVFVYLVGKDNKVKYTEIKVSPQNDGKSYIVTGGLSVGDRIVTKGITKLSDGMEIKPITEEQYLKKIEEAEKLGQAQDNAGDFAKAMGK
ncbi:efflux RND transporter periplasmic adaptor subunit [Prevotella sp. oral taxon 376]|uniref:efflux RND transporter periplasmic adaptor subunit n=1 Tax=Prevotella sp. oral taxon 376 TaxID=712466 RepID=UPI000D1EE61F|nr:efflux RND transporter periplasmic adaptor subunit [Prevotella sp. oral taxon 376]PTL33104.1 efflux RND transporter periplasmic adaptor subunit [Prevotella sp. oral taxon 376]